MKRLLAILICLLLLPVCAAAENENGYVARVATVQLYAAEEAAPQFVAVRDIAEAEALLDMGLILYYEVNDTVYLHDTTYWQQTAVGVDDAWEKGVSGRGTVVGVLDSGVYPHPDLQARLVEGFNVLEEGGSTVDTYGHGTRVAGIIAASSESGGIGMAPGVSIMPVKCFEGKQTTVLAIVNAITGAADKGCHILNMSFGLATNYDVILEAVEYAAGKGVLMVASAGNGGSSAISYPASYPDVISVAAVTEEKERAEYSQYNNSVDVAAPGNCIGSTDIDGDYMTAADGYNITNGTSFSAPVVAGVLALGREYKPNADARLLAEALSASATDLGQPGKDPYFGYGLVNAGAYLEELDRKDKPHLQYTGNMITAYNPHARDLKLFGAIYDSTFAKLEQFTCVTVGSGYCRFTIPASETMRIYLFDGCNPACDYLSFEK